jgi:hypothetical protein
LTEQNKGERRVGHEGDGGTEKRGRGKYFKVKERKKGRKGVRLTTGRTNKRDGKAIRKK